MKTLIEIMSNETRLDNIEFVLPGETLGVQAIWQAQVGNFPSIVAEVMQSAGQPRRYVDGTVSNTPKCLSVKWNEVLLHLTEEIATERIAALGSSGMARLMFGETLPALEFRGQDVPMFPSDDIPVRQERVKNGIGHVSAFYMVGHPPDWLGK